MMYYAARNELRQQTLGNLGSTDWDNVPLHVQVEDEGWNENRLGAYLSLKKGLDCDADYILFLEDDLDFNRHIRHNLFNWGLVKTRAITLASLYNPRVREVGCDLRNNARIVDPYSVFGSQAFLLSKDTAAYVVRHWNKVNGGQDIRISRLAARLGDPIFYHAPSLVQHIGRRSVWGGWFHQAADFDPDWKT